MATISKRMTKSGVTYRIQVKVMDKGSGVQKTHSTTWKPLPGMTQRQIDREVAKFADEYERDIKTVAESPHAEGVSPDITLGEYAWWWIERRKEELSASYYVNCKSAITEIEAHIGRYKMREISPVIIQRFYDQLDKKERTVVTVIAKPTLPEAMKENNRRLLIESAALKIANNFREGDYYVTFTYDSASLPATDEKQNRVRKDIRNTITKLKRRFEKAGLKFKYVAIPENLSPDTKGRVHFHILIPAMPDLPTNKSRENFFSSLWGKGNVYCKEYGGTAEDAFRLASYFKKQKKEDSGARILMSHNMAKPVEKKQEIRFAECYSLDINVPAGYEVVSEVSYQCYTRDGFPCQHVVLQKSASITATKRRRYSVPYGQYIHPSPDAGRARL